MYPYNFSPQGGGKRSFKPSQQFSHSEFRPQSIYPQRKGPLKFGIRKFWANNWEEKDLNFLCFSTLFFTQSEGIHSSFIWKKFTGKRITCNLQFCSQHFLIVVEEKSASLWRRDFDWSPLPGDLQEKIFRGLQKKRERYMSFPTNGASSANKRSIFRESNPELITLFICPQYRYRVMNAVQL